jgi:hypothetical protein
MKNEKDIDQWGTERWYKDGELHREDGPAVIYPDGSKFWYKHGLFHREDGPAVIVHDGNKKWYLNGYPLTKEKWWNFISDEHKMLSLFNVD